DENSKHNQSICENAVAHNGHPFHLVDPSPWPLIGSIATLILSIGGVLYMHQMDRIVFYIGLGL
ncbi:MAG: cytochrome c oxidase subunit 3, partial [Alphaproteobacteria bacterium]|nr:cytochrome c oxidase subunit 3 [Alphaproteobacteria bacterium]